MTTRLQIIAFCGPLLDNPLLSAICQSDNLIPLSNCGGGGGGPHRELEVENVIVPIGAECNIPLYEQDIEAV